MRYVPVRKPGLRLRMAPVLFLVYGWGLLQANPVDSPRAIAGETEPVFTRVTRQSDGSFLFSWTSETGAAYRLRLADSVSGDGTRTVGLVFASGGETSLSHQPDPAAPMGIYWVEVAGI